METNVFDFGRITDAISSLMSGAAAQQAMQAGSAADVLSSLGLDPALLDGLSQSEILARLEQHGIDPAQLGADQIQALMQNVEIPPAITDIAQAWLDRNQR